MVSPLITFQFWQRLDAAVRMLGDAACVECHVTHKTGLHSTRCRLDKVPQLKGGKKTPNPKQVWLLLLCSIVLSQLGWCWYRDLRFMNHPTPYSELFNVINRLGCDRKQVVCKQKNLNAELENAAELWSFQSLSFTYQQSSASSSVYTT